MPKYPPVALTSEPNITIGDINDINGTIYDKGHTNPYWVALVNTTGSTISPATEGTLELINSHLANLTYDLNNNLMVNIATTDVKVPVDIQDHWAEAVTLLASGSRTLSGTSATVDVGRFVNGYLCMNITAVSGTFQPGQGLRIFIDGEDEITGTYNAIYDSYKDIGHYIKDVGTYFAKIDLSQYRLVRVRWSISGSTPSFTFSVTMQSKS